ncbi:MAG: sarcosine oxidase subunit gamma family protein [Serratia inhibens]|uniref:sarcosine oxidase subunit gamma n=1 Tax=Serratia inhibens TaxID=2338073 RepID=UPI003C7A2955
MSDTVKISTFNSHPDTQVMRESPLALSYRSTGRPEASEHSGVTLRERPLCGHLILRGGAIVLDQALRDVLGIGLPGQPLGLVTASGGEISAQWLSPDEWLLIVPEGDEFEVENRLRAVLGDAHYAISNVSGGQTLLELKGEKVRELLMKSVVYDVHPDNFPAGKAVTTVFAKTTAILRRPDDTRWELVVRRSFADYLWRWLLDAGEEYGIGALP